MKFWIPDKKSLFATLDLQRHLDKEHKLHKFQCEKCDKSFFLKWRLIKHQKIHNSKNIKKCHYFNNQKNVHLNRLACFCTYLLENVKMFNHVKDKTWSSVSNSSFLFVFTQNFRVFSICRKQSQLLVYLTWVGRKNWVEFFFF